jgi:MFS family permease
LTVSRELADEPPADPALRVRWSFIAIYALAYMGVWLALLTPMLVTIDARVRQIAPDTATAKLSLVLGVGAIFALIGNPLFGHLSDRTTSRWGMRRPWMVGGMLGGAASLLLIVWAPTIGIVLVGWCLAQLAFNAVLAAIVAVLPDQVPPAQRGTVSGVLGVCMPVGQVGGTFLVQSVAGSMLSMFMLPVVIGLAAVLCLVFILPDRRLAPALALRAGMRDVAASFRVDPRRHPDFAWAWLSRFLLVAGTAFLTTYQPSYLVNKLGYAVAEVPHLIFLGMLVHASLIVIASLLTGRISDALDRRKLFVVIAAAAYALGLWLIAAADQYSGYLVGMAISGVGQGMYFASDLALVTQVLPDRELDAAKDLGIFNMANALPQAVAPALGPLILSLSGGDYRWLFIAAGAVALSSSVAIMPLRGVR